MNLLDTSDYFILLALAAGPATGSHISDQIIGDSIGGYLKKSTLYDSLRSLERVGLIERVGESSQNKVYKLTLKGKDRLTDAARLHERAARLAKARLNLRY